MTPELGVRGAALLDVNMLIALAWPNHVHHLRAREWFADNHLDGWATTPVTEIGFVRVSSNRAVIAASATPTVATDVLRALTAQAGHQFWADDVALVLGRDPAGTPPRSHGEVTDAHLLALTRRRGGRLVTFDRGVARLLGDEDKGVLHVLSA